METNNQDFIDIIISFLRKSILSRMDKSAELLSKGPNIVFFFKDLEEKIKETVLEKEEEINLSFYNLHGWKPSQDLRLLLELACLPLDFEIINHIDSVYISKKTIKYFDKGSNVQNKILFSINPEDKLSICGKKIVRKSNYFGPIYVKDIANYFLSIKEEIHDYVIDLKATD